MASLDLESTLPRETKLTKVSVSELPIRRIKHGRGARLVDERARQIRSQQRARIAALAIPPAWTNVRISEDPTSHIQAVGRDEAGRLQYIYHADWEVVRTAIKGQRLGRLLKVLPRIRRYVAAHLRPASSFCALAAAIRLIDRLGLRVGHEGYASEESGRGVATLLKRHVRVDRDIVRVNFPGKGGKRIDKSLKDPKLAAVIEHLLKLRGARLFKLPARKYRNMTATDINAFLVEISGEIVTAKDFRTLLASSYAIGALGTRSVPLQKSDRRRAIAHVAKTISEVLTNTPAIVKKSYVYPSIFQQYEAGALERSTRVTSSRFRKRTETLLQQFLSKHI